MHIWVQKSASIQLQTSSLKLAAQPAISCTYTSYLAPRVRIPRHERPHVEEVRHGRTDPAEDLPARGARVGVERPVASFGGCVAGFVPNLGEKRPVVAGEVALIPQHSADVLLLRDTRNLLKQPDLLRATLNHRY